MAAGSQASLHSSSSSSSTRTSRPWRPSRPTGMLCSGCRAPLAQMKSSRPFGRPRCDCTLTKRAPRLRALPQERRQGSPVAVAAALAWQRQQRRSTTECSRPGR